jgi:CelD/BcsL family acetyltransferase involved in cellulose biosynthesis
MGDVIQWESMETLVDEWDGLIKSNPTANIFDSFEWQQATVLACCESIIGQNILAVRDTDTGQLKAVVPLSINNGTASFLSDYNTTDFQDLLIKNQTAENTWHQIVDYLFKQGVETIDLISIRDSSNTVDEIKNLEQITPWRVEVSDWDVDPYISLPSSWDQFLISLRKKDRHELKRKFRRLENSGEISYPLFDNETGNLDEALDQFLNLMAQSKEEKAVFLNEERKHFLRILTKSMSRKNLLRLFFLEINGVKVSTTMSFAHNNKLYLYNSGYDQRYRSLSVGLLLKAQNIRYAIETGFTEFDFLRGGESYKYHLGGVDRKLHRFLIKPS